MPLSDIVNVVITRQTQSVSEMGFGIPMILGTSKNWNDLIRQYSDMQEVAMDFNPYDPEYIAAQDVFSQTITPPFIYIGRRTVDTVEVSVETAMPSQQYTTTINGTPVTITSNSAVLESQITLSGVVTAVINFSTDFNTNSIINATINSFPISTVTWNTNQATTIGNLATQMLAAPNVASATVTGSDQITLVFNSSSSSVINQILVSGTGSQPTASETYTGPLVTGNRINVSLNGTIVGTVTSVIDFSANFVASNSIVATVNGVALGAVVFTTNQATTIAALATQIGTASGVASSTVTGTDEITVVFSAPGNNTVNSVITTGGVSQPTATISEGGFVFTTNNVTTMDNIAAAIASESHIASAVVTGDNDNIITVTSDPSYPGVINFFTVTLGATQAIASIVNTPQAVSPGSISAAMITAINAASLPVTASGPVTPNGTYAVTANVSGVPYTIEVSTNITNPNACRVLITQAVPNQAYTIKINGLSYIYQAPNNVTDNDQISAALATSIASPILLDSNLNPIMVNGETVPNPLFDLITATDNGNGSLEVFNIATTLGFLIQVFPFETMVVQKGLIIGPYEPSASVVTDIQAIQAINDDWYALACTDRTVSTVLAIAAYIETQIKIFGTASADLNIINEPAGTDVTSIAAQLNNAGYARSFVMYHPDANDDYPECAWFGAVLPLTPGSETWKFKTLNTIAYTDLSSTQENNAFNKECNTYEYIGGVGITQNGTVAVGEYIDTIRGIDWLTSTIQTYVYATLINNPKVPYTDAGIAAIQSQIQRALQLGIDNNFIAANPPYIVTVPLAANVPAIDKTNRILNNVKFTATLAGAIQAINISGTVSV